MSKSERLVFWLGALGIWVYLGLRSYSIPLIHDEAVTYYLYFQSGNFIPPWAYWDANNHILHSAIGAFFHHFFSPSPFVVRLGSWLSFIPFLIFLRGIAQYIPGKFSRWAAVLVLFTTPFFIEFFSLARGYGMAMTWFLGALFFALKFANQPKVKWLALASISGFLAALANLSVIVAILLVFVWMLAVECFHYRDNYFCRISRWFVLAVLPLLPLVYYGRLLQQKGLLYYGGDEVVKFFLQPMARYFLNNREWWMLVAIVFVAISGFYVVFFIRKGWSKMLDPIRLFPVILIISLLAVFMQHWILGVNYPEDRAALYFFPLLVFSWATIPVSSRWKSILLLPLLWFPFDFVTSANVQYSKLWPNEHVPVRFWEKVDSEKDEYPISLSAYFLRNAIWNFHSLNQPYTSCPQSAGYPSPWADAIMVDNVRINQIDPENYVLADYDSISGQTLLIRSPKLQEDIQKDTVITQLHPDGVYTNLVEFNGHEWGENAMALYFDLDIQTSSDIMHLHIITTLFDTNGAEVFSAKNDLSLVSEHWKSIPNWRIKQFLPPFPENAGRFVSYIYNPNEEKHFVPRVSVKLATVKLPEIM